MKALTIHQPWASLIAHGEKRFETRSWAPGAALDRFELIAIHAGTAKGPKPDHAPTGLVVKTERIIGHQPWSVLPRGAVIAIARYKYVAQTEQVRGYPTSFGLGWHDMEFACGDFRPERYAWRLEPVLVLDEPIPAQGRQKLWNWEPPAEIVEQIRGVVR